VGNHPYFAVGVFRGLLWIADRQPPVSIRHWRPDHQREYGLLLDIEFDVGNVGEKYLAARENAKGMPIRHPLRIFS